MKCWWSAACFARSRGAASTSLPAGRARVCADAPPIRKLWGKPLARASAKPGAMSNSSTCRMASAPRRLRDLEKLAEKMVSAGADRHSVLHRAGRGRGWRCRWISGIGIHARHSGGADSDDAAGASRLGYRRQDRRQPESRQESDGDVSSASGSAGRSGGAGDFAGARSIARDCSRR